MEMLSSIWSALSTENQMLVNILAVPLTFVEVWLSLLLFTSILKIETNKKIQYLIFA